MFDTRKLSASKVSAGILRGIFVFAEYTGNVFFHFRKDHVVVIKLSWWKKGFLLILRLVPLGVYIYTYLMWILTSERCIERMLHLMRLVLSIPSYLAMIYVQFFHCRKVIKLINHYLRICRQARSLAINEKCGFGGGREFILILLSLACQLQEFVFLLGLLHWVINLENIISWASYTIVLMSTKSRRSAKRDLKMENV